MTKGYLTLITGPMFADKTTTFINLIRGGIGNHLILHPSNDTRYTTDNLIISHNGEQIPSKPCEPTKLLSFVKVESSGYEKVFIDEGHFYLELVEAVKHLLDMGIDVVVAGIDLDYNRQPFKNMEALDKIAKTHIKCKAICACGKFARYTKLTKSETNSAKEGDIIVGGTDKYTVVCGDCPRRPDRLCIRNALKLGNIDPSSCKCSRC